MNKVFYLTATIFLLSGSIFLGFKILDWIKEWRNSRFKTSTAHFLSDLYKLKIKWADVGEFGYVESLDNLIKFHGNIETIPKIGGVGQPLTNDRLSDEIQLSNLRKEEFRNMMNEFIQTEFRG